MRKKKIAIIDSDGGVFYLTEDQEFAEFIIKILNECGETYRMEIGGYYDSKGEYRKRR